MGLIGKNLPNNPMKFPRVTLINLLFSNMKVVKKFYPIQKYSPPPPLPLVLFDQIIVRLIEHTNFLYKMRYAFGYVQFIDI
jgi:hypothetical protein